MIEPNAALETALGYEFKSKELLSQALTHRSFRNERGGEDNERLEFLGDAALSLIVAEMLYGREPTADEGQLTRRRAELVCERGLCAVAQEVGVGDALLLGKGEDRSGGRQKSRLLASAFEGLVGAILLDGGFEEAQNVVHRLLGARAASAVDERDPKSELQERIQRKGLASPTYRLERTEGPEHDRVFHVSARVDDEPLGSGEGRSKARAEKAAARNAIEALKQEEAAKQDEAAAKQDEAAAKQREAAAKQDEAAAKQDEAAAKQDEAAAKQDEAGSTESASGAP